MTVIVRHPRLKEMKDYLKSCGIRSVDELAQIVDVSARTLLSWWIERPVMFRYLCDGIKDRKFAHRGLQGDISSEKILKILTDMEQTTRGLAKLLRRQQVDVRLKLAQMETAGQVVQEKVPCTNPKNPFILKWFKAVW